jgi:hypothetical protein
MYSLIYFCFLSIVAVDFSLPLASQKLLIVTVVDPSTLIKRTGSWGIRDVDVACGWKDAKVLFQRSEHAGQISLPVFLEVKYSRRKSMALHVANNEVPTNLGSIPITCKHACLF